MLFPYRKSSVVGGSSHTSYSLHLFRHIFHVPSWIIYQWWRERVVLHKSWSMLCQCHSCWPHWQSWFGKWLYMHIHMHVANWSSAWTVHVDGVCGNCSLCWSWQSMWSDSWGTCAGCNVWGIPMSAALMYIILTGQHNMHAWCDLVVLYILWKVTITIVSISHFRWFNSYLMSLRLLAFGSYLTYLSSSS